MAIFAIILQPDTGPKQQNLSRIVLEKYPSRYELDGGHGWLIPSPGPAKAISDDLGITDGSNGAAVVFEIASYFGRANPNLWSWIKVNWNMG